MYPLPTFPTIACPPSARGGTVPASTILVLEPPTTGDASLAPILSSVGYTVTRPRRPGRSVREGRRAPARHHRRRRPAPRARPASTSAARSGPRRRWRPIPILCVGQTDEVEERIRFLEAGADDVDAPAVRRPRGRGPGRGAAPPLPALEGPRADRLDRRPHGRARHDASVAVYSPKGGVGTTTIATNIAIAAAQRKPDRVVLVDLDLQFGGVATHLNLEPKPDARRRRPRRGGAARAGAAADLRRRATTAGCTSWRRRSRPRLAELVTPDTCRAHPRHAARGL